MPGLSGTLPVKVWPVKLRECGLPDIRSVGSTKRAEAVTASVLRRCRCYDGVGATTVSVLRQRQRQRRRGLRHVPVCGRVSVCGGRLGLVCVGLYGCVVVWVCGCGICVSVGVEFACVCGCVGLCVSVVVWWIGLWVVWARVSVGPETLVSSKARSSMAGVCM